MFDALKRKLGVAVLGSALKSLATNQDTKTTIAGILAAAMVAVPGFDLSRLLSGDLEQIARVLSALAIALLGYWTTKTKRDGAATASGAIAGGLYASSGQLSDIIVGVVMAYGGYLANKPAQTPDLKQLSPASKQ